MSANITLRLDDKVIQRIEHLAHNRNASVSDWIGELVTQAVQGIDGFEGARIRAMAAMSTPIPVHEGPLDRDQSHER